MKKFIYTIPGVVLVNLIVLVGLFSLVEALSSVAMYQQLRDGRADRLASVYAARRLHGYLHNMIYGDPAKIIGPDKFDIVTRLRSEGVEAYPAYSYDPQLHMWPSTYYLSQPSNSTIVLCNENDFWATFKTDEIGFRNPKGQAGKSVDFILLGSSFVMGACVQDEDTIAGLFRASGNSVLNLGHGGAGPLADLARLREYGAYARPKTILWFVFLANLFNLREEKGTKLYSYFEDDRFSQNLLERRGYVSAELKAFLNEEIERTAERKKRSMPLLFHDHSVSLDALEAKQIEVALLKAVADKVLSASKALSADLRIVMFGHPSYPAEIQDIERDALVAWASEKRLPYLVVSGDQMEGHFAPRGPHFSPAGYRWFTETVLSWLASSNSGTKTR
jgi:hypothetical protein